MSAKVNNETHETLFSFEVLVDYIRIESKHVSGELVLALRLLDFPTLIVYQPEKSQRRPEELHGDDGGEPGEPAAGIPSFRGDHVFRKGKSCLFKISMEALHSQLADTPLYAMVLDVGGEVPTLVGTSLIPLAQLVGKIRLDVNARGICTPSSHGEKGHIGILNLMGDRIGVMSLKYKLLSLGTSLLPHILEKRTHVISSIHDIRREHVQRDVEEDICFTQPLSCGKIKSSDLHGESLFGDRQSNQKCDATRDAHACVATQTEPMPRLNANPPAWVASCPFEENPNVFCPPNLFYSSSGEETGTSPCVDELEGVFEVEGVERFTPEAIEHPTPQTASAEEHDTNSHKQEDPNGLMQNFPLETLRQLPLLNALLVELSQLTRQGVQQPLSIHPHLAWIYSPTLAQPLVAAGTNSTAPTQQPNTPRQKTDPRLGDGSETHMEPVSKKHNDTKRSNTSAGRTLKYGTTRTFQLRLKRIPPGQAKHRVCLGIQSLSQTTKSPADNKKHTGLLKHDRGKTAVNQTASVDEEAEAVIHSLAGDSAASQTGRLHMDEHQSKPAGETFKVEMAGKGPQKHSLRSESNTKRIPANGAGDEDAAALGRGDDGRGGSTQTRPLADRTTEEEADHDGRSSRSSSRSSSRLWSPHSTHRSASSRSRRGGGGGGGGGDEEQYMDDFNSLDPSEGRSPDPLSSPESGLAPLGRSRRFSESPGSSLEAGSNGPLWRGPPLPVPVGARGSPQRSLRATHIIRPRTQVSALSVSSDDDYDGVRSVRSSRTAVRSSTQTRGPGGDHGGAPRSSVTESLRSSRGRLSDSAQNSGPVGGLSADSDASYDSCEVEELRDGLGSLDLKINYQHVSELVTNKLPGYTL
ncbi:unnamed protein product [Arctogadus glacialis]